MRTRKKCLFGSLATARFAVLALAPAGLMVIAAGPAYGQAPNALSTSAEYQADAAPKPDDRNESGGNGQAGGQTSPSPASTTEKEQIAVNPITGMAVRSGANYVPLTGKERWQLYWEQNYLSVGAYFGPVLTSLVLDQAANSPKEWGGGVGGYGRRLASRTGGNIIQGTVQATAATILHEDVRYIASTRRGTGRRILHAIAYSVVTYNGHGRPTPNLALIGGYYASTAISTSWLPGQRSVARYTVINGTEQIGLGVVVNVIQEFWSELTHRITRRR